MFSTDMTGDAHAGLVTKICVWRFSRLGRNLADSAAIIHLAMIWAWHTQVLRIFCGVKKTTVIG